jgi:WD40 repeat protein
MFGQAQGHLQLVRLVHVPTASKLPTVCHLPPFCHLLLLLLQCHRRNEQGTDVVFPVNCIAYHPQFGTFATGGGDGVVNIWDGNNKKRLFQVRLEA